MPYLNLNLVPRVSLLCLQEAERRDPGNEVEHTFSCQHNQLDIPAAHDGKLDVLNIVDYNYIIETTATNNVARTKHLSHYLNAKTKY